PDRQRDEVIERRRAMAFLAADQLAEKIRAERIVEKRALRRARDRNEPRHHDKQEQHNAERRPQRLEPARIAIGHRQRRDGQRADRRRDRSFDENAAGEREPEEEREAPIARRALARRKIQPRQRQLRRDDAGKQHRIGLGEMRLDDELHRSCKHGGAEKRCLASDQSVAQAKAQEHGGRGREQGRQAIRPDRGALRIAEKTHRGRLQPVNAGGLFVARFVLEANVDEIAGFQHLPARLRETRLVAIGNGKARKPRQIEPEAEQKEQHIRAPARDRLRHHRGLTTKSCAIGMAARQKRWSSARETAIRVSSPPRLRWRRKSSASPSSVTALATSLPPGFSAPQAASQIAASPTPPPMKIASGAGSPSSAAGAGCCTISISGTPKCAAFSAMKAARGAARSIAIARMKHSLRSHSMAIEPLPAPISHSNSPGRGASAASVAARIARFVSWPSWRNASSGRPARRDSGRASAPARHSSARRLRS